MRTPDFQTSDTGEQGSRSAEATRLLAAALVPLGLLASAGAEAGMAEVPDLVSHVEATVTGSEPTFTYNFTVFNDTLSGPDTGSGATPGEFQIVDWELPFFSLDDLDRDTINQPGGWGHEILERQANGDYRLLGGGQSEYFDNLSGPYGNYTWNYDAADDPLLDPVQGGDEDLYGPNPGVFNEAPYIIHWVSLCIENPNTANDLNAASAAVGNEPLTCDFQGGVPGAPIVEGDVDGLSGFSFVSGYSAQNAPYLASWFRQPPTSGDPPIPNNAFGTPYSPARQLAQGVSLPAPGTALLLGAGLVAFGLRRRRALIA